MREIAAEELAKLFTLIPVEPGGRIYHIAENGFEFIKLLKEYLEPRELEYDLMVTNEDFFQELVMKLKKSEYFKIKELDLTQNRYNSHTKIYDMLFITVDLSRYDSLDVIKKVYRILKNAAHVIVVVPFDMEERVIEDLTQSNFVAINNIDISKEYKIISAKKLHGWKRV